jgi:hypothetical protein
MTGWVTARIRERLKVAGKLRGYALNYQSGIIVQFHQNAAEFRRGERLTVRHCNGHGVQVERGNRTCSVAKWTKRLVFRSMNLEQLL